MKKISSGTAWFQKRIFPIIWFGFLFVMAVVVLPSVKSMQDAMFLLGMMLLMAGFGYLVMLWLVFDLCDEAWDAGTHLVLRKGSVYAEVYFKDIKNVGYFMSDPPRLTLTLREPCALGSDVVFSPAIGAEATFLFWTKPKIVQDLIERVDQAR